MVINARTSGGDPVEITFHKYVQIILSGALILITSAILWGVSTIVDVDKRVNVLEASRFTRTDASAYVTLREYDASRASIASQLSRIENKLDRLMEAP